jgi:hypothetical protein
MEVLSYDSRNCIGLHGSDLVHIKALLMRVRIEIYVMKAYLEKVSKQFVSTFGKLFLFFFSR